MIAISTGGVSPALARTIRLELENSYGPEFGKYLSLVKRQRARAMKELSDPQERNLYLKALGAKGVPEAIREKAKKQQNS